MKYPYGTGFTNEPAAGAGTNDILDYIDHTTEADLVREKIKDGDQEGDFVSPLVTAPQGPLSPNETGPQGGFIRDPVLARGVDFIRGLAALRLSHT